MGLLLGSAIPPERTPALARLAETAGFAELWVAEHYFYSGAPTAVAAALDATERVPVGTGVVSAVVRNPAVLALELATLGRLHPGRVRCGVGLGELPHLRELGIAPRSSVAAVRDCVERVRRLLAGEADGAVKLAFPPQVEVPLYLGVAGPRLLELSGALADGTILSWVKGPGYVRWARERIESGADAAGSTGPHRLVSLAIFSVDEERGRARTAVRAPVARELAAGPSVFTDASGISDELRTLGNRDPVSLAERMPERWLEGLTVSGTPDDCVVAIRAHLDAGADTVALFPFPAERAERLVELAATEILPRLHGLSLDD